MALHIDGLIFDELSSDPGSPVDGQMWYNTTEDRFKVFRDGSVETLFDKDEFDAHTGDTANPHDTDLEEARSAGNVLSGPIDMGGNKITNLGAPSAATDATTQQFVKDQIDAKLRGLDWQESVLDQDLATPPGSPAVGDRYLIATGGTGAWSGKDGQVTEWDGTSWIFSVPNEGFAFRIEDENLMVIHDGTSFGPFGGAVDHGNLVGLGDDDHTQYLLADGTRALTGDIDMGTNDVTNVGLVDGVDVSAHAARHIDGGSDVIDADKLEVTFTPTNYTRTVSPTEVDALDQLTAHLAGIDDELANVGAHAATHIQGGGDEIDGDKIDIDFTPANYTPTTAPSEADDLDQLTAHLAGIDIALTATGTFLSHKAGHVLVGGFSGSPKKATVTFAGAFGDANYAVTATPVTTGGSSFLTVIESQVAGSFVISLGSSSVTGLTQVNWVAMKDGES